MTVLENGYDCHLWCKINCEKFNTFSYVHTCMIMKLTSWGRDYRVEYFYISTIFYNFVFAPIQNNNWVKRCGQHKRPAVRPFTIKVYGQLY